VIITKYGPDPDPNQIDKARGDYRDAAHRRGQRRTTTTEEATASGSPRTISDMGGVCSGRPPPVMGAELADLVACWMAGQTRAAGCRPRSRSRWRPGAQGATDFPVVAERVGDPGKAPAVFAGWRAVGVAPAVTAWPKTASGSSTTSRVRPVAPPTALGWTRCPADAARATQNAASPMASWATMSSPPPTRCSTMAPKAA
jgi:hypothetical protein